MAERRENVTVILLMGLPGSGKSTLARKLLQALDAMEGSLVQSDGVSEADPSKAMQGQKKVVYIEYDAIEESILQTTTFNNERKTDEEDYQFSISESQQRQAWNEARLIAVDRLREELDTAATWSNESSSFPKIILMDDNFHLRGMRKQIHRLLLHYKDTIVSIKFGILWLTCPLQVCLEYNRQRTARRVVPDHVIENMCRTLEPPTRAAWESSNFLEISSETPWEDVLNFVNQCPNIVDLPPEPDEEQQARDRQETLTNQIHNLDKLLRQWVGQTAEFDKRYAKTANGARKGILQRLKDGVVDGNNLDSLKDLFLELAIPLPSDSLELRIKIKNKLAAA
ncbi:chromatin associated protein KTI12 [Nitzschia inconspicua]|uniref:Chromatin associated protein KTI12 n=1 Tax=Nitzschia inconspicua TaxID=303405 RepID=A0A9K3K5H8_9STRA|nr:chromatin associated protein KTI12 [Nitzschia inconspicua]KAG7347664.1 chromatin associated protein KTI12 [Nitzschia inconspicua]